MSVPTSRVTFIEWCKRRLGAPVTALNIDDTQIDDCVDIALQKYQRQHFNGTELVYTPYLVTQTVLTNKYITLPPNITGVTKMFQITAGTGNVLSATFILASDAVWQAMRGQGMLNYQMLMNYRSLINGMTNVEKPIRFNRVVGKVYIDMNWTDIQEGSYIVLEGYSAVDATTNTLLWQDEWLQNYAVSLIKKDVGTVLKKYSNAQLPGGITLDGQTMYNEAVEELKDLNEELDLKWSYPASPQIG